MIQKTNHRSNIDHQARQDSDPGIEQWGQWWGRKHYSLEVVQQPLRARMCGFGDKDRRPLAPAAVAKMVVRREDNSIVDVEDIDCSFFLVTVDLWSADGKREMNLVLHPSSSSDRYVAANAQKSRKPRSTNPPSSPHDEQHSPTSSHSTPNSAHQHPRLPVSTMNPMVPAPPSGYANQSYPYPQQAPIPDNITYDDQDSYGSPSETNSAWGYASSGTPLDRSHNFTHPHPSLSSYNRNGIRNGIPAAAPGEPWQAHSSYRTDSDAANYRNWSATEPSYPVIVNSQTNVYAAQEVDPSMRHPEHTAQQSETGSWPQQHVAGDSSPRYVQESFQGAANSYDHPHVYGTPSQPPYYQSNYTQSSSSSPSTTNPPLPRHTYTRTLVGPLSSNACRLLDEHRQSGIFFLFQDLSVRTEGTFRLRLRLMNVGE
ncbi:velvet factor-domain-containing protein [Suillus ampliporus]|nr:velvet factor-domain-containing protein [Suillus ampliporus]